MKTVKPEKQRNVATTAAYWNRCTGVPVSDEDARQMIRNIAGFFSVLAEWDRRDRERTQPRANGEVTQ